MRATKKRAAAKQTKTSGKASLVQVRNRPLRDLTAEALRKYLVDLNGNNPDALYDLVLGEVEHPLFSTVMDFTGGNQSRAAKILGINRATLRKKLHHYQLLK